MTPAMLQRLVNADRDLVRRGRLVQGLIRVDVGGEAWFLSIDEGRIAEAGTAPQEGPGRAEVRLTLSASREEWEAFWEPEPRPGHHDLMALLRRRVLTVEGDTHLFMSHLRYVKDVLEKPRTAAARRNPS
jgi:murein tripeptide amidase MpaA